MVDSEIKTAAEIKEARRPNNVMDGMDILLDVLWNLYDYAKERGVDLSVNCVYIQPGYTHTIKVDNCLTTLFTNQEAIVTDLSLYETIDVMFRGVRVRQVVYKESQPSPPKERRIVLNG